MWAKRHPHERKNLIAQINEGHVAALASKFEIEQAAIEGQSLFDVANPERHMVEATARAFLSLATGLSSTSLSIVANRYCYRVAR
jgi:hypothetical protein